VCFGHISTTGGFTLAFFQGQGGELSTVGTGAALIFCFQNKFIIVLTWGHQVDKTHFQKCAFLKVLLATLMMGIKPKAYVVIMTIKSKAYFKLYFAA
jgi:hypothetical protein